MKTLIITLFLLCSFSSFSQDKMKFKSYFESGYFDGNVSWNDDVPYIMHSPGGAIYSGINPVRKSTGDYLRHRYYSDINFSVAWKGFAVTTNYLTIVQPITIISYQPLQS